MYESIHLVFRVAFLNISLPVFSVMPMPASHCRGMANARMTTFLEYLSEHGQVVNKEVQGPKILGICLKTDYVVEDGLWPEQLDMYEFMKNKNVANPTRHIFRPSDLSINTTGPQNKVLAEGDIPIGGYKDKPRAAPDTSIENNRQTDHKETANSALSERKVDPNKQESESTSLEYTVSLSPFSKRIFSTLQWFGFDNILLTYHYSEFDTIPFLLQLFLHMPLILTGSIILLVIFTLDPDIQTDTIKNAINGLPTFIYTADMNLTSCSVCLDEYAESQELRRLRCNHCFHKHCIDAWLIQNIKCPICRVPVADLPGRIAMQQYPDYFI